MPAMAALVELVAHMLSPISEKSGGGFDAATAAHDTRHRNYLCGWSVVLGASDHLSDGATLYTTICMHACTGAFGGGA